MNAMVGDGFERLVVVGGMRCAYRSPFAAPSRNRGGKQVWGETEENENLTKSYNKFNISGRGNLPTNSDGFEKI